MLVFLLYLLQNKWWVRLNNQALWDCICFACMFVFLLSTICLHLYVNYFSMCLLKVFLNLKRGIYSGEGFGMAREYIPLSFQTFPYTIIHDDRAFGIFAFLSKLSYIDHA